MKSIRDNTRRMTQTQPVKVVLDGIEVDEITAFWLVENSELNGDTVRKMAAQILMDVARDDILAHAESPITLQ